MKITKWTLSLLILMGMDLNWSESKADTLPANLELVYEVSFGVCRTG